MRKIQSHRHCNRCTVLPSLAVACWALGCANPPAAQSVPAAQEQAPGDTAKAVPRKTLRVENVGFETPESALYWAAEDVYLVSNINGGPLDADNNGFISKVLPDGTVAELKFIDGANADIQLHAPKGMAVSNGVLWVSDIDTLRAFDLSTGKSAANVFVPKATFLNDVAVSSSGIVYVSDSGMKLTDSGLAPSGTDAIYTIDANNQVSSLIAGTSLGFPNGLTATEQGLRVVSWSGKIYSVSAQGVQGDAIDTPAAELDGIVPLGDGRVLISSWAGSSVYVGLPEGPFEPLVSDLKNPADIGFDTKRSAVLIPLFQENVLLIQPVASQD